MGFPLVIGFFTPEYECEIEGFCASLEKQRMEYEVVPVRSLGSWRKNVGYKPRFITEQLIQRKRAVLFIDVDAFVEGPCDLLRDIENDYDFAGRFTRQPKAHNRPGDTKPNKNRTLKTVTTGTLWFNTTKPAMELLRAWTINEMGQYLLGQLVLSETWHHEKPEGLRTLKLPDAYCWQEGKEGKPEIRHTRGAKRHRTEAGHFDQFSRSTESMRVRTGMRYRA